MSRTYITDITHCLDKNGNISEFMNAKGLKLAFFLASVVEKITEMCPATSEFADTGIKCRLKKCNGTIQASLGNIDDPIHWHCKKCGDNGIISNWMDTQWSKL